MKPGRNGLCPCGSGKKYKHCCGIASVATAVPFTTSSPAAATGGLQAGEIAELVALVNRHEFRKAEQQISALLNLYPNAGILWKMLGVVLSQQGKEALEALRRTVELIPHDAEAHRNLGVYLSDQGQWAPALASLRRALHLTPNDAALLVEAADATRALDQPQEAIALYRWALTLNPRAAEAHNNLGNAYLQLGCREEAVRCYWTALEWAPNDARIHCNLGNAQRQLGLFDDALASSKRAIALDPTFSAAHNNLGLVLRGLGRRADAVASYQEALRLNPNHVESLNNLGQILPELGQRRMAVSLFARAIELDPKRAETYRNLGDLLFESREFENAESSYRRALALEPFNAMVHAWLGAALRMQGQAANAEACCNAALAIDANCVAALLLLGELRADRGKFSEAEEFFRRVIALDSGYPFAYFSIATIRKMTRNETAWLAGIEALLVKLLPLQHEISLHYALGKYHDDIRQYDDAFYQYRQANELTKCYGVRYDRQEVSARIDSIIESFDVESIRELQAGGHDSERPVFIVGMPRSGTSLTEQILASHPAVFGAGELAFWQNALSAYEAARRRGQASIGVIPDLARDYLRRLTALSGQAVRVIDKMPQNFMAMGMIHATFPRARIIHLRRHPIDTCLSIYFNYFSLHPYANDFENLRHYYREYLRITDHWRSVLPGSVLLEVPYEALVEDQEHWSRRILTFLDLPWNPNCLKFHQTDRVVITLSKWQVRQRISSASAGRWHNYEKYVGPLLSLVDHNSRDSTCHGTELDPTSPRLE